MTPLTDDEREFLGKAMEEWEPQALVEALLDNAPIEWLRARLKEERENQDWIDDTLPENQGRGE